MDRRQQKTGKKKGGAIAGVILVYGLLVNVAAQRAAAGSAALARLVIAAVAVAVLGTVLGIGLKRLAKTARASDTGARPIAAPPRDGCVYDQSLETGNSQRDTLRRREQLDGFLENGLIDREEYRTLLRHFEESQG